MLVVLSKRTGAHIFALGVMGAQVLGPQNIVKKSVDGRGLFLTYLKTQGFLMNADHSVNTPLGIIVCLLAALGGTYGLAPLPLCEIIGIGGTGHIGRCRQVDAGIRHVLKKYINGVFFCLCI